MEHATVKEYGKDPSTGKTLYRITPDEGYLIKNKKNGKIYTDVITDAVNNYEAIAINEE